MQLNELQSILAVHVDKPKRERKPRQRNKKKTFLSNKLLTYKGRTQTAKEWSKEIGLSVPTITARIKRGFPIEQILYPGNLRAARKQANHYWNK